MTQFLQKWNSEQENKAASVYTCEWWGFAQGAVLVMNVGGAVAGTERGGGGQH